MSLPRVAFCPGKPPRPANVTVNEGITALFETQRQERKSGVLKPGCQAVRRFFSVEH
jgi:hypothetical protein